MIQVMPTHRSQVQECKVANRTRKLKMVHLFNEDNNILCYCTIVQGKRVQTSNKKHFQKMLRDVGMAVPKTTETRYGGGSVQARQGIQGLHK